MAGFAKALGNFFLLKSQVCCIKQYLGFDRWIIGNHEETILQTTDQNQAINSVPGGALDGAVGEQVCIAWRNLTEQLTPLLLDPKSHLDFSEQITQISLALINLVACDSDVAIFQIVNPTRASLLNYGVEHSIHTAVLMSLIARHKEWTQIQTVNAVCAALTMNISITQLQTDLAKQSEPPTSEQKREIIQHPSRSRDILVEMGVMQIEWLRAVYEHHEQHNGSGYPQGIRTVSPLSDALRTSDMFCAKLSERASRARLLSTRAAQEIFRQNSYGYFGATIVRILGMYPPGCLVRLLSGCVGIVLQRSTDPMRPRVALLTHDNGEPRESPIYSATGIGPGFGILGAVANNELAQRFTISELYSIIPY